MAPTKKPSGVPAPLAVGTQRNCPSPVRDGDVAVLMALSMRRQHVGLKVVQKTRQTTAGDASAERPGDAAWKAAAAEIALYARRHGHSRVPLHSAKGGACDLAVCNGADHAGLGIWIHAQRASIGGAERSNRACAC